MVLVKREDPALLDFESKLKRKYGEEWMLKQVFDDIDKRDNKQKELSKEIYNDVKAILKQYMDMTEDNYHIVTLWIIGTYIYEEFSTFPLLFVNATKQSGKTRLLKLIEALAWNGRIQANLSEAVLFRMKKKHTLLIDEFEQVKERNTLREIINASYKKGAIVERMTKVRKDNKETYEPESFDLYSPLAMANIWGMDEVVEDRCIVVRLDRTDDESKSLLLENFDTNPKIKQVVDTLLAEKCRLCVYVGSKEIGNSWNDYVSNTYTTTLTTYTTLPTLPTLFKKIKDTKINGRQLELFFPLIIISKIFNKEDLTLEISKKNFEDKNVEEFAENPDVTLLDFLWRKYSEDHALDYIRVINLTNDFKMESPFDMNRETMGRSLQRLNIILDKKRDNKGVKVMLDFAKIKQKLERYKGVIEKGDSLEHGGEGRSR